MNLPLIRAYNKKSNIYVVIIRIRITAIANINNSVLILFFFNGK